MSQSLDELREDLRAVDTQLLELMAKRQRLAGQIGAVKRAAGKPTRDYQQEREVVKRARKRGEDLGVPGDVAEELMLMLIRSSLTVQEQAEVVAGGGGLGKRVLVIGGAGKMGRWMVRFLASQGYAVEVADPASEVEGHPSVSDYRDLELDHDIIVIAAPLQVSADILTHLAEKPPAGLIFDVGSLKTPLRSGLSALANAGARVVSVRVR